MPKTKKPRCKTCGGKITMMVQRGTGYCCALCAKGKTEAPAPEPATGPAGE